MGPQLDLALGNLVSDLSQMSSAVPGQSLLDRTLIVAMGEFGRTPPTRYPGRPTGLNPNNGRDHYANVQVAFIAGGGVQGGRTIGETSADGSSIIRTDFAAGANRTLPQGGPNIRMED